MSLIASLCTTLSFRRTNSIFRWSASACATTSSTGVSTAPKRRRTPGKKSNCRPTRPSSTSPITSASFGKTAEPDGRRGYEHAAAENRGFRLRAATPSDRRAEIGHRVEDELCLILAPLAMGLEIVLFQPRHLLARDCAWNTEARHGFGLRCIALVWRRLTQPVSAFPHRARVLHEQPHRQADYHGK